MTASRAPYDSTNIFARILAGDIPCKKLHETEHSLAFHDIAPQAPVHVLVIPKGAYRDMADFCTHATTAEIDDYLRAIGTVAHMLDLPADGFRLISNSGAHGGQEVPHLHVHLLGGRPLGRMLAAPAA